MANYSYLCATDLRTTYPAFSDSTYDPDSQTVACDVYCIPLLWMGLFRPDNIVAATFDGDEGKVYTEAPLVERSTAIIQLRESVSVLNELFEREGALDDYAEFLIAAISSLDLQFLTIEMEEIACLCDDERAYYDQFRAALASLSFPDQGAYDRFRDLSQLRPGSFPPARMYLDRIPSRGQNAEWNFCRILGARHFRPVPWESETF